MENLLTMTQFNEEEIMEILNYAEYLKRHGIRELPGKYLVSNLFFEPSTRTKLSFEIAERKLGLEIIQFDPGHSSTTKGETLFDTVKTLEALGVNAVVIRHPEKDYYKQLEGIRIPVFNGGDGTGQHPSQSLLDLFTIKEEFGSFRGLNIVIAGDLSHSRVAASNAEALRKLGANVSFVCPPEWSGDYDALPEWDQIIGKADVVMLLRVQHERHDEKMSYTKEEYHARYGLTEERAAKLKEDAIIMHPAPINWGVEIAESLMHHPKLRVYEAVENGVYIRAAAMEMILRGGNVHAQAAPKYLAI
ncbi:aspartate carbamoyltransferase catalytic subunit [Sporosarcina trichiuri]|uniref:aspartate carbamoyltransferase catalytic subunit n=1 Tax=Sporosarcina trichiuri TaxID=3056445 RepID=UPI0025B43D4E|nr:aspartate carbamoyltransferase catalytic subunit [Sporosarcina sp. 0.2-SM1T-5]WJY28796.1 aspartate carbamoyltransferase catalytic subunit [Sporosarcina sp. 0.2-SM1T-5]